MKRISLDAIFAKIHGVERAEFDRLAGQWGEGAYASAAELIQAKATKHFDGDVMKMLRSADAFSIRGARSWASDFPTLGCTRYEKNRWVKTVGPDGRIIQYFRRS